MTVAKVEIEFSNRKDVLSSPEDKLSILRELFINFPSELQDTWSIPSELFIDFADIPKVVALGIGLVVTKIKGTVEVDQYRLGEVTHPIQVHVPNIGLFYIKDVIVEEDCCTLDLQKRLDSGWHILCVCPPNSQRRPDYILRR